MAQVLHAEVAHRLRGRRTALAWPASWRSKLRCSSAPALGLRSAASIGSSWSPSGSSVSGHWLWPSARACCRRWYWFGGTDSFA
ncbi:hypothetical protein NMB32_05690 [Stenotrophomonas sp. CD2]|nr:hypothetical protein NMB32_05690 [Stenotrophomonas sp. CD2]